MTETRAKNTRGKQVSPVHFSEVRGLVVDIAILLVAVYASFMNAHYHDELYKAMVYTTLGFITREVYNHSKPRASDTQEAQTSE